MKKPLILISGTKYNGWTILKQESRFIKGKTCYFCQCRCGTQRWVRGTSLKNGWSIDCGCTREVKRLKSITIHNLSKTPVFRRWAGMMTRCYDQNCKYYYLYGGRGITVSESWHTFINFFNDMGHPTTRKHTLERKNNSLGYCKENCCWATQFEQAQNRRTNVNITFNGTTLNKAQWAKKVGVSKSVMYTRLGKLGWSIEKALTTPAMAQYRHG